MPKTVKQNKMAEKIARKLSGIESVPAIEQQRMIQRAVKAAMDIDLIKAIYHAGYMHGYDHGIDRCTRPSLAMIFPDDSFRIDIQPQIDSGELRIDSDEDWRMAY